MTITGTDIVFATLIVMYFGYEIYRLSCIREVARLAAEAERRQALSEKEG